MKNKLGKIVFVAAILGAVLVGVFIYQYSRFNDGKLHIVICDVGQGDGIFIRTPNATDILIDAGPDKSILNCLSKNMPFWDRTIELAIGTHPDKDHVGGFIDVIERYRLISYFTNNHTNTTQIYQELEKSLKHHKIQKHILRQGNLFRFKNGGILKILWPKEDVVGLDINNFSVVGILEYKDFQMLLTADAEATTLEQIDGIIKEIDILKVPHHGSKTGLNPSIVQYLRPKLAVISVGAKNKYGHPTAFILDLLKSKNIKILRTDLDGEIEIMSDGNSWGVKK